MIETGIPPERKEQWQKLVKQLHDPFKLCITVLAIAATIGFLGIYRPMDGKMAALRRQVAVGRERVDLIREVESLREKRMERRRNFPEHPTVNFWTEPLLQGIRAAGVALAELESEPKKIKIGDFQGVYFNMDVSGEHAQVRELLTWIENNDSCSRAVRIRYENNLARIEAKGTVAVVVEQESLDGA